MIAGRRVLLVLGIRAPGPLRARWLPAQVSPLHGGHLGEPFVAVGVLRTVRVFPRIQPPTRGQQLLSL